MLMVRDVTARVLDGLTLADRIDKSGGFAVPWSEHELPDNPESSADPF